MTSGVTGAPEMPEGGTSDAEPVESGDSDTSAPLVGLADMPSVQPHAIAAAEEDNKAHAAVVAKVATGKTDPQGRAFDPALHEVDPVTGEPRLSTTGKLRCKRGRGAKGAIASGFKTAPAGAKVDNSAQTAAEKAAKIDSTATVVTEMIFMGGKLIGGEEWEPRVDKASGTDERAVMKGAWAEYFRVRGIVDVPPEVMLVMAVGSYAVPRMFMPKTKTRVQAAKEWFYRWVATRRARRNGGVPERERQAYDQSAFSHPMQP